MAKIIYKSSLDHTGRNVLNLPYNSRILKFGYQKGSGLCVWYEFDSKQLKPYVKHVFYVVPTGDEFPSGMKYCDTILINDGFFPLVWHIYQKED